MVISLNCSLITLNFIHGNYHTHISDVRNGKNKILHKNSKQLGQHSWYHAVWKNEPPQRRQIISEKKLYLGICSKIWSVQPATVAEMTFIETHWLVIVVLYDRPRQPHPKLLYKGGKQPQRRRRGRWMTELKWFLCHRVTFYATRMNDRIKVIF